MRVAQDWFIWRNSFRKFSVERKYFRPTIAYSAFFSCQTSDCKPAFSMFSTEPIPGVPIHEWSGKYATNCYAAKCNIDAKCNKIFNAECNNLSTQIVITFLTHNVITQNVIISEITTCMLFQNRYCGSVISSWSRSSFELLLSILMLIIVIIFIFFFFFFFLLLLLLLLLMK